MQSNVYRNGVHRLLRQLNLLEHEKPQLVKEEKDPLPGTKNLSGNEAVEVAVREGRSDDGAVDEQ